MSNLTQKVDSRYFTADEIRYIRNIGAFTERPDMPPRAEMLRRYIAAAEMRSNWGELDRDAILSFARRQYGALTGSLSV